MQPLLLFLLWSVFYLMLLLNTGKYIHNLSHSLYLMPVLKILHRFWLPYGVHGNHGLPSSLIHNGLQISNLHEECVPSVLHLHSTVLRLYGCKLPSLLLHLLLLRRLQKPEDRFHTYLSCLLLHRKNDEVLPVRNALQNVLHILLSLNILHPPAVLR